jgi:hypothetical protein
VSRIGHRANLQNFVELRKATTAEGAIEEIGAACVRIRANASIS